MSPVGRSVAALAVILVHLLILVEGGAGRACPEIANLTTFVTPYAAELVSDAFGDKVPVNAIVALSVRFTKIGPSVCDCRLHQIDNDRAKLKAQVKDCFGGFLVILNEGMYRVSIICKKKRRCPRLIETVTVAAEAIDCGHPGDIENGHAIFTTTTFGSTATYSCDEGYQLQPYPEYSRICLQGGNWIGELPVCVVDCGTPPEIANGTRIGGYFTTVGNTVFYFCNDFDATLVGNDTIACLADGTWEDPPMCMPPIDCGLPPPIANGTVSGIGTGVGSTAYYACLDSNYTLVGNSSIVCRDDGAWEDPPMCVPVVDCGPPPRIENGFAIPGGTSVFYVCNSGYDRDGPSTIVCNKDNGMWQMPPMCKRRQ